MGEESGVGTTPWVAAGLSETGRQRVEEDFSVQTVVKELVGHMRSVRG